jgi:hypothetical protein
MKRTTVDDWAFGVFGHAEIEDKRWGRRLVQMASRAARRPAGRVTEAFSNDAERQGAYGLLESEAVSADQVASPMFVACARQSEGEPFVYCAVDGTSLTLTDTGRTKGFGSIGSRAAGGQGIKVINAMVLSPEGIPIGVSSQRWWVRPPRRRKEHREALRPEEKETRHWLDAIEQTRQVMQEHAPGTRCWFQLDREGDAWPILKQAGLDGQWFTVRSSHNRRVILPDGKRSTLRALLAEQPVLATDSLEVRGAPKRQARIAKMELRACQATLEIRDKRTAKRSLMTVNVVQALERGTTPAGEKPIRWILLTNVPIETLQEVRGVVTGYSMRWRIEEFHRAWKSGACRVEETQLRSPSAVIKWATILTAVAIRVERIKQLARETPERPATDEFSALEIRAAALLRFEKSAQAQLLANPNPSVREVALWIAKIGGYTGTASSKNPPGSVTLARGLKELRVAVRTLQALGRQ